LTKVNIIIKIVLTVFNNSIDNTEGEFGKDL